MDTPTTFFIGPIIIGVILLLVLTLPFLHGIGVIGGKKRLRSGDTVRAKVLEIEQGLVHEDTGLVDIRLLLEVKPKSHAPYQVRAKRCVPASVLTSTLRLGQVLQVKIASEDPNQLAIPGVDMIAEPV
jgi:hypothetical protein